MGARNTDWHPDKIRERIKASQIVNALVKHALGQCHMKNTQVRAAEILLRKVVPDLSSVELTGEIKHNVLNAQPVNADEWAQKHVLDGEFTEVSRPEKPPLEESAPLTPLIESLKRSQGG